MKIGKLLQRSKTIRHMIVKVKRNFILYKICKSFHAMGETSIDEKISTTNSKNTHRNMKMIQGFVIS